MTNITHYSGQFCDLHSSKTLTTGIKITPGSQRQNPLAARTDAHAPMLVVRILFESLVVINCNCGSQFDHCAVWDAVPEPPCAARKLSESVDLFR